MTTPAAPERGLTQAQRRCARKLHKRGCDVRAIASLLNAHPDQVRAALRTDLKTAAPRRP